MKTSSICVQDGEAHKVTMTLLRPLPSTSPDFPLSVLQLTAYNLCLYLLYCNQPGLKRLRISIGFTRVQSGQRLYEEL